MAVAERVGDHWGMAGAEPWVDHDIHKHYLTTRIRCGPICRKVPPANGGKRVLRGATSDEVRRLDSEPSAPVLKHDDIFPFGLRCEPRRWRIAGLVGWPGRRV